MVRNTVCDASTHATHHVGHATIPPNYMQYNTQSNSNAIVLISDSCTMNVLDVIYAMNVITQLVHTHTCHQLIPNSASSTQYITCMLTGTPRRAAHTLMGSAESNRHSEHTGQLASMALSRQVWLLNMDRLMQALHSMQWKKSMPSPRPRLRCTRGFV